MQQQSMPEGCWAQHHTMGSSTEHAQCMLLAGLMAALNSRQIWALMLQGKRPQQGCGTDACCTGGCCVCGR